jgi:alanine dehydrogenase
LALTNATLPYTLRLANQGWKKACQESIELRNGLNVIHGKVVYKAVADAFGLSYTDVKQLL